MSGKLAKKLEQREHVLHRPDTYIGTVRYGETERLVADFVDAPAAAAEGEESPAKKVQANMSVRIHERTVQFCPGLTQLFLEILNNARDRTVATDAEVRCSRIDIHVNRETGELSVSNNGDSVPVQMHPEHGVYNPELIFGHLLTSTNYDDNERRIAGGRNGFGAKLTNIFSTRFTVECLDARCQRSYRQTWTANMSAKTAPEVVEGVRGRAYTRVSWVFDHARFGKRSSAELLDEDFMAVVRKAVVDVAATVGTKVTVTFNGREIPCDNLTKYVDCFPALHESPSKLYFAADNGRWKVAVCTLPEDDTSGFRCVSFVNGMCTTLGGTHENHVLYQITDAITAAVRAQAKGADKELVEGARNLTTLIRGRMWVFVDACIENPEFTSQTKECLKSPVRDFGSACDFSDGFVRKLRALEVAGQVLDALRGRSARALKNTDGRKVARLTGIPKYESAAWAGTARAAKCLLILTEGDSAKATAVAGLKGRTDRERFGVFPLRGKIINVRNASAGDLQKCQEFVNLKQILGLQQDKTYESDADRRTLRYGGIIVMTDQDTDGFHISALVQNIFATFWPHLLRTGFVHGLPTPVVKISKGTQTIPFYTVPHFERWLSEQPDGARGWKIKYFKGLGTSTSAEAVEYFRSFKLVQYVAHDHGILGALAGGAGAGAGAGAVESPSRLGTDELMARLFSDDHTDYRKEWVRAYDPRAVDVDPTQGRMTIADFMGKMYIQHASDNLQRTIPNVIDGLKPSQRKILFGCFEEGLDRGTKEMKVAQLGAAVAKTTNYHHGEASLMEAIVNMAQDFVGANNMNLLVPSGQFGTRLMGGKDAASPRYIFTRIADIALKVFRKEDNDILERAEDDGDLVEPTVYIPIIPMVLVNGADGIGTGFSTTLPPANPRTILENVRRIIRGGLSVPLEPYMPWWRGFTGTVTKTTDTRFVVSGRFEISGAQVRITELPIGTWTSPYKEFLDAQVKADKILDYTSVIDDVAVDITVDFPSAVESPTGFDRVIESAGQSLGDPSTARAVKKRTAAQAAERAAAPPQEVLKLSKSVSIANVNLFTTPFPRSTKVPTIKKYADPNEIYADFFETRMDAYVRRKAFQVAGLERDLAVAQARADFLRAILENRLVIERRAVADVETDMAALGLPRGDALGFRGDSYEYLLGMKLSSLTAEKLADIEETVAKLAAALETLRATAETDMWLRELEELERVL